MGDLTDVLKPYVCRYPLYEKSVYSSMAVPEIRALARKSARIVLTGVVSECCVLSTCMEAIDQGHRVVYLRDACSGSDASTESAVENILSRLAPLHVSIMNADAYWETLVRAENMLASSQREADIDS